MTITENHTGAPSGAELARLFVLQHEYRWQAKRTTAGERCTMLRRLRESVVRHTDEARDALYQDLRKPAEVPMMLEVEHVLRDIDDALENLDAWMTPAGVAPTPGLGFDDAKVRIEYEERGVCLLFGPWNFPFQLVLAPLVPIIAAGNTAIVKPNEMTPATSSLLAKIIRETFDEREVAVVEGGVETANKLLELPVDHIFFTGSPAVAKIVMAAAAKHLASVTLELGGKCPAIIDDTADIAAAAAHVGTGKVYNAGQICLSPDYVLVKESVHDEFVDEYLAWIEANVYVDGKLNRDATSKIIDHRNLARVAAYVEDAVGKGAQLRAAASGDPGEGFMNPVVLLDVPDDASILREEIFGPVLPVLTFEDTEAAIARVRSGEKPLAMYIFSSDADLVSDVLSGTSSGGVTVNGWATHFQESKIPFGGVGASGMGSYHGFHGFKELSHARSVVIQP